MNIIADLITSGRGTYEPDEKNNYLKPNIEKSNIKARQDVESFDARLIRIISFLKEIHKSGNQNGDFELDYLVELFDRDVPEDSKRRLIKKINTIGFDILRDTFKRINMECEDYYCESEDLFGIFKRHQFNKKLMRTESDKLRQVIQYVHLTLIHVNILHKKGIYAPAKMICSKKVALHLAESFVKEVESVLRNILNQQKQIA